MITTLHQKCSFLFLTNMDGQAGAGGQNLVFPNIKLVFELCLAKGVIVLASPTGVANVKLRLFAKQVDVSISPLILPSGFGLLGLFLAA